MGDVSGIFAETIAALQMARGALDSELEAILAAHPQDCAFLQELQVLAARHAGMAMQLQGLMHQQRTDSHLSAEAERLSSYFDDAECAIAARLGGRQRRL
jgi:hypothetical protein